MPPQIILPQRFLFIFFEIKNICYNQGMIIDSHVHFGKSLGYSMPQKDVLTAMERYGISKIIVSSVSSVETDTEHRILPEDQQVPMIQTAKDTIDFAKSNSGSVFAAIWVKPQLEQPSAELEYLLKIHQQYVKAIKIHPFYSSLEFDSPKIEPYIELAERLELPVIVHTANDGFSECRKVYNMAKRHPHVKFVMAHLGLETDHEEAIDMCAKLPNLFGDTAWVSYDKAIKFIKKAGSEKLLFGSDMPIDGVDTYAHNKTGDRSIYQDYFYELEKMISADSFEKIMWKNAENFFKL